MFPSHDRLVSSVFGRTGNVVASSGDYNHSQLNNSGVYSHDLIDLHLLDTNAHIPSGTGYIGAFLVTDGIQPYWIYPSGFGHIILDSGVPVTMRPNLNFIGNVVITDDSLIGATTIEIIASGTSSIELASVLESNAGVISTKTVTPEGLPLRVESNSLINNPIRLS